MQYFLFIGLLTALFLLLLVTKDVDAAVINTSVVSQDTITSTMVDGNGCIIQEEDHEVGENLLPLQTVTCHK